MAVSGLGSKAAGASFRLGINTSTAERNLRGFSRKLKNFASTTKGDLSTITAGFRGMNASTVAATAAVAGLAIGIGVVTEAIQAANNA